MYKRILHGAIGVNTGDRSPVAAATGFQTDIQAGYNGRHVRQLNRRLAMNRRYLLYGFLLFAMSLVANPASGWQPAEGPLKTRWTTEVSPQNALPEYPRPQMVRKDWTSLNGLWQYALRPAGEEPPAKWDGEILVPYPIESALSGVMKPVGPDQRLFYRRWFSWKPSKQQHRLLLHFGAVDWRCTVWVNDRRVGEHIGGYDPFTFEITDALREGDNELIVAVTDPTDTGTQPRGKQVLKPHGIFYTAVTGIWQTVWLEPVPKHYIRSFKVTPNVDNSSAEFILNLSSPGTVRIRVLDGNSEVATTTADRVHDVKLAIPNAKFWSPDKPFLYRLDVALLDGDKVVDKVDSYFGMRKIEVRKDAEGVNRLWLNDKAVFQYGPLDQGWWPDGLYTAPTDAALKYDIEMTKKFGMNMIRKHVKVEPARWYYWCDTLGVLVWQDMVSGDAHKTAESRANYRKELKAMIDALHNHPSILMWVPFNEGWGQHDTPEVSKWVKEHDPSRLVNEASGWHDKHSGDVSDMHSYPGPGMREPEKDRVGVLGEFGGLGMPVTGHTWQQEKNWGYVSYDNAEKLTDAYVALLSAMRPLIGRGLSAAVYTQTTDVEIEVNGLMTYDREIVKMDRARIKAAAEKLYSPPPRVGVIVPSSEKSAQTWRYTMTKPDTGWFEPGFDDSQWKTGPGGFGTEGTPGAVVHTKWASADIWLRRTFELKSPPKLGQLALSIHHDDDAEVYLNGTQIKSFKRHTNGYQLVILNDEGKRLLKPGNNTLAVHCHQISRGQYIDAGLVEIVERSPQ